MVKLAHYIIGLAGLLSPTLAMADYQHELTGYLDYTHGTGRISSGDTNTDLQDKIIKGSLGYGYFVSPSVEPVFDITMNNLGKTTGTYKNSWSNTEWNVGVLFNSPDKAFDKDKTGKSSDDHQGPISSSRWIPYGGFLLGSRANTQAIGENTGSESIVLSKLTAGIRYMIYPHIGINTWIKASYENSAAKATSAGTDNKGVITKLVLEFRLFSLAIFF
ncbi:MAG: hypothetical protein FJ146_17920 [Deltaproteobacteria bacterium]|nr:hypothetical protein [Deltaproteobacteria bacterium]